MDEYISKTALLRQLDMAIDCKDCPRNTNKELYKCVHNPTSERRSCSDIAHICNTITDFETFADVQPVIHGYWKEEEPRVLKCSVCGEYAPMNYLGQNCIDSRYCPWCGARMIKDGDTQ